MRKYNIQSLKKKKGKINFRIEINIIIESDIKIISKRYKISKKNVTKIIMIQIDNFNSIDEKIYVDLIHHVNELKSLIFDRVNNIN